MKCIQVRGGYNNGEFVLARVKNVMTDNAQYDAWSTITNIVRLRKADGSPLIWHVGHWDKNTWG